MHPIRDVCRAYINFLNSLPCLLEALNNPFASCVLRCSAKHVWLIVKSTFWDVEHLDRLLRLIWLRLYVPLVRWQRVSIRQHLELQIN